MFASLLFVIFAGLLLPLVLEIFQCFDVFDESKSEFGVGMLHIFNVFDESES